MSSDHSEVDQPSLAAHNPALDAVLTKLSPATLRDVIKTLAASDPAVEAALKKALFVPPDLPLVQ